MKTAKTLAIVLALGLVTACSDEAAAKESDAMKQVTEDVDDTKAAMEKELESGKAMLEKEIAGYEVTLGEKQKELDALLAKLKELSPADMLGDAGKALKADVSELEKLIADLTAKVKAAEMKLADLGN